MKKELKEYMYHLDYIKYNLEETYQILFFASLYSYQHYGRGLFDTNQRGTNENEVKSYILNFIKDPEDFTDIIENIEVKSKKVDKSCYYISVSDLNSLNYSISVLNTSDFKLFFQYLEVFEFENTFKIFKNIQKQYYDLLLTNEEKHKSAIDYITYLKEEQKSFQKFLNKS